MNTVGVLSAYHFNPVLPLASHNVTGLCSELANDGLHPNKHYHMTVSHSNDLDLHYTAVRGWLENDLDLIFAGGTPLAYMARRAFAAARRAVPMVYYGAHPVDGGRSLALADCMAPDTVCVRIQLPLTYSHRTFRILRLLFPELERIHIPFARNTVFCHPQMAQHYDCCLERHGPHAWLTGCEVGFPSLRDLCWIIDADYREYPLRDTMSLRIALQSIPIRHHAAPVTDLLIAFNDTFHVAGAPSALVECSTSRRVPLIWVNNTEMARHGALADFCNPFAAVARHAARHVRRFLTGDWHTGSSVIEWNSDLLFTLNLCRADELGVPMNAWGRAEKLFHQIIPLET